jgi:hypothetical protein
MADCGALQVMLPEIGEWMEEHREPYLAHLREIDRAVAAHGGLPREFVLALIYFPLAMAQVQAEEELQPGVGWGAVVEEWFRPYGVRMHIAVKHRSRLRALVSILGRVAAGPGRRKPRLSTAERKALPQALTLMRMLQRRDGGWIEHYERWRALALEAGVPWVPVSEPADSPPDEGRPRGRRRRRRRRGGRKPSDA